MLGAHGCAKALHHPACSANHGGVQICAKGYPTIPESDWINHSLQGSQLNCLPECPSATQLPQWKSIKSLERCRLNVLCILMIPPGISRAGGRTQTREERRVEQERRLREGGMLHSSSALVGKKRDPMISDPALISVYIFVPHGTKGAEREA